MSSTTCNFLNIHSCIRNTRPFFLCSACSRLQPLSRVSPSVSDLNPAPQARTPKQHPAQHGRRVSLQMHLVHQVQHKRDSRVQPKGRGMTPKESSIGRPQESILCNCPSLGQRHLCRQCHALIGMDQEHSSSHSLCVQCIDLGFMMVILYTIAEL